MGRLGFLRLALLTGYNVRALSDLAEHGDYDDELLDPYGYENEFTATHFFRREEFESLLANGISVRTVSGLEGLGSPFHDDESRTRVEQLPVDERDTIVRTIDELREDPVVADLSIYMLAIGSA